MTWPEVVSDFIKIGLGAIIGGAFALIVARQAHTNRLKEEYSRRRRDQLEKISERFDEVSRASTEHVAHLHSLAGIEIPENEREATLEALGFDPIEDQKDLGNLIDELHSIEARLALLSLHHISEEVERYRHLLTDGAIEGLEDKRTDDEKATVADSLNKLRTVIFTLMALAYEKS